MNYTQSKWFKLQIVLQTLILIVFVLFGFSDNCQILLCGFLLFTIGIPHGSNDQLYRKDQTLFGMLKFLFYYLGIIFIYIALWIFFPLLSLLIFFMISFHHFGQSNFENENIFYPPSILWGFILLSFPVFIHFEEAMMIFKSMVITGSFKQIDNLFFVRLELFQLFFMLMLTIGYLYSIYKYEKKYFIDYFLQITLVSIWYFITPLLFGFVVVFCLWHSVQSIRYQNLHYQIYTKKNNLDFLKSMVPFSLIALSTVSLYINFLTFKIGEAFILLSLITLPHVIMMNRLYKEKIITSPYLSN